MRKVYERLLALLLVLTLAFSLFACNRIDGNANGDQGDENNSQETGGKGENEDGSQNTETEESPDKNYENGVLPDVPPTIECADTNGEIKNIILIIGDGMGEAQLDAGELIYGKEYAFRDELNKFYSDTNSLNSTTKKPTEITDSAASATAMATGYLTQNKYTGIDQSLKKLTTLLDVAAMEGKSTGVVTTDALTGATPAGFTAHTLNRNLEHDVIKSQIKSGVNLLVGQYDKLYANYEEKIKEEYNYFDRYDEEAILAKSGEDTLLHCEIETESDVAVRLSELAMMAVEYLSQDSDGFVLVIEQAHIDKHCHNMKIAEAAAAVESLNETVEAILAFAKESGDTAVIVTADHETRGLQVSSDSEEYSKTVETEAGGTISYNFSATYHTDTLVPVYTWGFEAHPERCKTFEDAEKIKNTEIFHFVVDLIENS